MKTLLIIPTAPAAIRINGMLYRAIRLVSENKLAAAQGIHARANPAASQANPSSMTVKIPPCRGGDATYAKQRSRVNMSHHESKKAKLSHKNTGFSDK